MHLGRSRSMNLTSMVREEAVTRLASKRKFKMRMIDRFTEFFVFLDCAPRDQKTLMVGVIPRVLDEVVKLFAASKL